MAKISSLPQLANPTGEETVPVLSADNVTHQAKLSEIGRAAVRESIEEVEGIVDDFAPLTRRMALHDDAVLPYALTDQERRLLAWLDRDARWNAGGLGVGGTHIDQSIGGPPLAVANRAGEATIVSNENGTFWTPFFSTMDRVNRRTPVMLNQPSVTAMMHHYLMAGQSLSVGGGGSPELARVDRTDETFAAGLGAGVGATNLLGTIAMPTVGDYRILYSAMAQLKFLIQTDARFENDHHLFASGHGRVGLRVDELSKGTDAYADGMWQVEEAARIADARSVRHQIEALLWIQGEADWNTDLALIKARITQLIADYRLDIAARNGQEHVPPFVSYQCSSEQWFAPAGQPYERRVARSILELVEERSDILCFAPTYHMDYSDGVHMLGDSYAHMGQHLGRVLYELRYRSGSWTGFRPRIIRRAGDRAALAHFHVPVAPIVFRTDRVSDPGNYGFTADDQSGDLPIVKVVIGGPETVRVVFGRAIVGNATLSYADVAAPGTSAGRLTGPRGCLFDSDWTLSYDPIRAWDGKLANPCMAFTKPIL